MSVIAQYGTDGARQAWYTQSLARIDEVLSVVNGAGKFWYQSDALGSVYALTTQAGEVRARGGYDVFGESVALSGTAVGQPFGFTGREHEADSGLVYARDRYLIPQSARWTQQDRLVQGGDYSPQQILHPALLHPYGYVSGQTTLLTDPLGLSQLPFPDTIKAYMFRLMVRGAYTELIAFMEALGLRAMQRGQAVQQLLQEWLASGAARIIPAGGASGGYAYRVADFLDKGKGILVELKFMSACNFTITSQIRDFAAWASQNGYRMVLVIRNSELLKPGVAQRLQQLQIEVVELADYVAEIVEMAQLGGA